MNKELVGKSTVKRRKAAKLLQKEQRAGYCEALLQALKLESLDQAWLKNWMTLVELLKAVGFQKCTNCAGYVYNTFVNIDEQEPNLVMMHAASCMIRLKRTHHHDTEILVELLHYPHDSVKEGALEVLGYDRVVPEIAVQDWLLDTFYSFGQDRPAALKKGLADPRYGLAAACAGWSSKKVLPFLGHCLETGDEPVKYVAKHALKKKYVRLR